ALSIWNSIMTVVGTGVAVIYDNVVSIIGAVVGWWTSNHEAIHEKTTIVWNTFWNVVRVAVEFILNIVRRIIGAVLIFWDFAGETLVTTFVNAWNAVVDVVGTALSVVWDLVTMIMGPILDIILSILDLIVAAWDRWGDSITTGTAAAFTVIFTV